LSHNGFYLKPNIENALKLVIDKQFDNKTEIEDDYEYYWDDAMIFLEGNCHLFAKALQEKFGYKIAYLINKNFNKIHWFCIEAKNNKTLYIDVRGITDDREEFKDFHLFREGFFCGIEENINNNCYKLYKECINFATYIIEKYPDYYDVKEFK